jgi:hypothetical protein
MYIKPGTIITDIEEYYGLVQGTLKMKGRTKVVAKARKIAMHLCRKYGELSWEELADLFHRDLSTARIVLSNMKGLDRELSYFSARYECILNGGGNVYGGYIINGKRQVMPGVWEKVCLE